MPLNGSDESPTIRSIMENFVQIGLFVLLGILFRRLKAFPKDTAQTLNMFALYISLPAVILIKVPQMTLSGATGCGTISTSGMAR